MGAACNGQFSGGLTSDEQAALIGQVQCLCPSAAAAVAAVDERAAVVFWNPAAERMLGWTAAEALDRPLHDLVVPEPRRGHAHRQIDRAIDHFDGQTIRVYAARRGAGSVPMLVRITPVAVARRTLRIATVHDLGRDFAAEQDFSRQTGFLQSVIDAIPVPVFQKDEHGRYRGFNRAFESLLQQPGTSLLGKTVYEVADPALAEMYATKDARVFRGEDSVQVYEGAVQCRDGLTRTFQFHKAAYDSNGDRGLVGVMLDISDLRREQALHRALAEAAPCGIALVKEDGTIRFANAMLGTMVALPAEALVGRRFLDLLWPDEQTMVAERLRRRLGEESAPAVYETVGRRADGSHVHWEIHASRLELPEGVHIHKVIVDVTERRGREQQLRIARDAAEAANRAKSAFIANISHELRTPLNAVLGFGELCVASANDDNRSYLEHIREGATKLLGLVDELLDLAHIEAGALQFLPRAFCLLGLLDGVVAQHAAAAEKGRVTVSKDFAKLPHCIIADEVMVGRVIANLLSNAIKFTPRGGAVMLSGHVLTDGETGARLELVVTDTGIGIRPTEMERLFRRFEPLADTYTKRHEGLGAGLFISQQLVQRMGGTLAAESQPNQGSRFWVTIPLVEAALPRQLSRQAINRLPAPPG